MSSPRFSPFHMLFHHLMLIFSASTSLYCFLFFTLVFIKFTRFKYTAGQIWATVYNHNHHDNQTTAELPLSAMFLVSIIRYTSFLSCLQPPASTVLFCLTIVLIKSHIIRITRNITFCVSLFHLELFLRFIPVLSIIIYHPPLVSDYCSIIHNLSAHQLMDIWISSRFWLECSHIFMGIYVFIYLG